MAWGYDGITNFYQANFPKSAAGNLTDLRYVLYDVTTTGGPSIIVASTNAGIVEIGNGSYGVDINLSEGRYSIQWSIVGFSLVANEEINILENVYTAIDSGPTRYDAFGTGTDRFNSRVNETIILQFQFLVDNIAANASSITKVEIFDDYDKAVAGNAGDVLETILPGAITDNGAGLYTKTAAALTSPAVHFDKITLIPELGKPAEVFILPFYVGSDEVTGVEPGAKETVKIILNICNIEAIPDECDNVIVTLCSRFAKYGDSIVKRDSKRFNVDATGIVRGDDGDYFKLIETTTMSADSGETVYYELSTLDGDFTRVFSVPKGTVSPINFFDLPELIETG